MLEFLYLINLFFQYFIETNSGKVGIIKYVSLNLPSWSPRLLISPILNGTCNECLCTMAMNSSFSSSMNFIDMNSFNCFTNNNTCQFFSKATFYKFHLNDDINTTFYFLQQPKEFNNSDLVAWHSFDGGSYNDSSGNQLNAIAVNDVSSVPGQINEALSFYSTTSLYQIGGFVKLGQSNTAYTVALWVRPNSIGEAPLVHLSSTIDGEGWCIDMLGFLTNGNIVARSWQGSPMIVNGLILNSNIWTHVTTTYDPSIGLRLYINGTLINQTIPFNYLASSVDNYLTLANSISAQQNSSCNTDMIAHTGVFQGSIDELRVYARALSEDDIYALAKP